MRDPNGAQQSNRTNDYTQSQEYNQSKKYDQTQEQHNTSSAPHKKVFGDNEGEYVEFEEIKD